MGGIGYEKIRRGGADNVIGYVGSPSRACDAKLTTAKQLELLATSTVCGCTTFRTKHTVTAFARNDLNGDTYYGFGAATIWGWRSMVVVYRA